MKIQKKYFDNFLDNYADEVIYETERINSFSFLLRVLINIPWNRYKLCFVAEFDMDMLIEKDYKLFDYFDRPNYDEYYCSIQGDYSLKQLFIMYYDRFNYEPV